jgi:16S rRNA (guanine527-N7)-methyltransferase
MTLTILPQAAAELLNITLTAEQQAAFIAYRNALILWNKTRANLTAIVEPEAVEIRHFLDSLMVLKAGEFSDGARIVDVGTGAGFPGLPLRIIRPHIQLTLMEATGKKITFLQHMAETLAINNISFAHSRAEEAGQNRLHRESYDVVLARAVAYMPVLLEYLLPLAKPGGMVIAMKGESAKTEVEVAHKAAKILGGTFEAFIETPLPGVEEPHFLVVFKKTGRTPKGYPRTPGTPSKQPL